MKKITELKFVNAAMIKFTSRNFSKTRETKRNNQSIIKCDTWERQPYNK